MTRTLSPALAFAAGLTVAVATPGLAQAGGLLDLAREAVNSNVSDPDDDEAVRAEREFYDNQTRDERQGDSAVQAEQDYYDSQTRAERDYYASQNN